MKQETIYLYTGDQHAETAEQITKMAIRFHVMEYDVVHAMVSIAKDSVWSKLERDVNEEKRKRKRGRNENE